MLQKQSVNLNFRQGLNTKTDPWQVPMGQFLDLENMVFTVGDRLTKRNGYAPLPTLPLPANYLTTFNGNLTAIGSALQSLSQNTGMWINKGINQPISLNTLPLVRSSTNQSQVDTAILNGLICVVYTDQNPSSLSTKIYSYSIVDAVTGENIVDPTQIPVASGTVTGSPRVFALGSYFIIVFTNVISATSHLQYIAISASNPTVVYKTNTDIASSYTPATTLSWDGVVAGQKLFIAYNTTTGGQAIKITSLSSTLNLVTPTTYSNSGLVTATIMSLCADLTPIGSTTPIIYATYWDSVSQNGFIFSVDYNLNKVISTPQQWEFFGSSVSNITTAAQNGLCSIIFEVPTTYPFSSVPNHNTDIFLCTQSGTITEPGQQIWVGIGSKAFIVDGTIYFLGAYQSTFQSSYFLVSQEFGSNLTIISRIAYGNGGGYYTTGLPSVSVNGLTASMGYLVKDFVTSQNTSTTQTITKSNIYSQTGINLVNFNITTSNVLSSEIAQALHLTGGFLWEYDGVAPVEHNFLIWPEDQLATAHNSGGSMVPQEYQYQFVYTWTDNQGNIHRSAPSIPLIVDMSSNNPAFTAPTALTPTAHFTKGSTLIVVSSATGLTVGQIVTDTTTPGNIQAGSYIKSISGTNVTLSLPVTATVTSGSPDTLSITSICSVVIDIPTLRLTYKNNVTIQIFRWSTSQQEFFQTTSISSPLINDTGNQSVTFTDTNADNQISGNSLIYTTGNMLENIAAPSFNATTLFDDRLWGINAEDTNSLWYSKQVIETTPVEMSDLSTLYIAPSIGAQGSTGPMKCIFPLDDKLIIFKNNALYYINGTGPDNDGLNSQYSQPFFITSVVGSSNQLSIVFIPDGLMFQSDKGIWLLGRGLDVSYIGAPVEQFTQTAIVTSAHTIPKTTQVVFTLNSGITLMYDYFWKQWGTFTGAGAISSTLYENQHTLLNSSGMVLQQKENNFVDNSNPVLMKFVTSWVNLAGLQGYQRAFFFYLLGQYLSPHFLEVGIAYDYNPVAVQKTVIRPDNYSPPYGTVSPYGQQSPYGGPPSREQWRIFFDNQRCQAFQLQVQEIYDSSFGVSPGAGLTISGINMLLSVARSFKAIGSVHSTGSGGVNGNAGT